jgi:hypothetical protein
LLRSSWLAPESTKLFGGGRRPRRPDPCHKLVQAARGEYRSVEHIGEGVRFTFDFPLGRPPAARARPQRPAR